MRRYLESLLAEDRVRIVEREVSGQFELAAVTQCSQRESDAPLLFRRVAGSRYPVMTNIDLAASNTVMVGEGPPSTTSLLGTAKVMDADRRRHDGYA